MKPAASLRALLTNLIDYAGLFPPASLSLDESIRNYARYVNDADAWMLGRFICPAAMLQELHLYLDLFASSGSLRIASLGRGGNSLEEFVKGTSEDQAAIEVFQRQSDARANVDVFETRTPQGAALSFGKRSDFTTYLEATVGECAQRWIEAAIGAAAQPKFGFKLRTGGVEASAFPPTEQIAFAIAKCRENNVPLKFTAGLHHPIRHFNSSVNTKMHGFINVFVAGVLAHALNLSEEQLVPILLDEDPASFAFDDDGLRWKDYRATTRQVADARKKLVISYGSCSFDEPREDLRSLGWL